MALFTTIHLHNVPAGTIKDFGARAGGTRFWKGGVAYGGDIAVYPGKG